MTNKEITQYIFDSFSQQDITYFQSLLTDESTLTADGGRTTMKGAEAITGAVGVSFLLVPDLKVDVKKLIADSDTVVAEVVRTGTHSGRLPLPDDQFLEPTGNEVFLPEVIFFQFQAGNIQEMRIYTDQLDTQRQFGML